MISDDAKAVIEAVTRKMEEHELLVRIDERGKVYERDIKILFEKQSEEKTFRAVEIDSIRKEFNEDLGVVKKEVGGVLRVRDMVSGAIGLIGFIGLIFSIGVSYFKIFGH